MECRPISRRSPFKELRFLDFQMRKVYAMQQMIREEIEKRIDALAREFAKLTTRSACHTA
jgi:hypothetical protein